MTIGSRVLWFLLRGLGIPQGQPSSFYKAVASGILFVPAAVLCLLHAQLGTFGAIFWSALAVTLTTLYAAPRRSFVVAALFSVIALRFVVGFAVTHDYRWLLAACGSGAAAAAIHRRDHAKFE